MYCEFDPEFFQVHAPIQAQVRSLEGFRLIVGSIVLRGVGRDTTRFQTSHCLTDEIDASLQAADVNANYFKMKSKPCKVTGWLMLNGKLESAATSEIMRRETKLPVSRSAIWWSTKGEIFMGWVRMEERMEEVSLLVYSRPFRLFDKVHPHRWRLEDIRHAVGAGPMLVRDGKHSLTRYKEFLFDVRDDRHPRTAVVVSRLS